MGFYSIITMAVATISMASALMESISAANTPESIHTIGSLQKISAPVKTQTAPALTDLQLVAPSTGDVGTRLLQNNDTEAPDTTPPPTATSTPENDAFYPSYAPTPSGWLNVRSDGFSAEFDREGEIEIPYETNDPVDVEIQIDVEVFAEDCETPATDGVFNIFTASNLTAAEAAVVPSNPDLQLFHVYLDVNKSIVTTSNVWSGSDIEGTLTACVMTTLNDPSLSRILNRTRFVIDLDYSLSADFDTEASVKSVLTVTDIEMVLSTSSPALIRRLEDLNESEYALLEDILEEAQTKYIQDNSASLGIDADTTVVISVIEVTQLMIIYDLEIIYSVTPGAIPMAPNDLATAAFSSGNEGLIEDLTASGISSFQDVTGIDSVTIFGRTVVGVTTDFFEGTIQSDYTVSACICDYTDTCDSSIKAVATLPLRLCIKSDSPELEVNSLPYLTITQQGGDIAAQSQVLSSDVVLNGQPVLTTLTTIDVVDTFEGWIVAVETTPVFDFFVETSPQPLTFSGTVDLQFKTSSRMLRVSIDNSAMDSRSLQKAAGSAGFIETVESKPHEWAKSNAVTQFSSVTAGIATVAALLSLV